MARTNNPARTGGQQGQAQRPGEFAEPGLPWSNAQPGQHAPHGYDPHVGQLPWPQSQAQSQAQSHPQQQAYAQHQGQQPQHTAPPLQQYAGQQSYAPAGYAPPTYPQPQAYVPQPDTHHGHYFPQGQTAPAAPDYHQQAAYAAPVTQPVAHQPAYADPATLQRGYADAAYGHPHTQPSGYQQGPASVQVPATRTAPPPPVGAQAQPYAQPNAAAHEDHHDEYEDEDEDEEEPRRRFGFLKVLGVLAVAVALGGGAAYAVKKFGGSLLTAQTKPVPVKADAGPAKAKQAASLASDGKASERLGGDQMPAVVPADGSGEGPAQARKVQTIPIQASNAAPLRPTVSMPGMVVDGGLPPAPPAPPAQQAASAPPLPPVTPAPAGRAVAAAPPPAAPTPAAVAQKAPIAPRVIASAEEPPAAAKASPPAPAKVAVARPAKQSDAYSPASGVGAASIAPTQAPAPTPAPAKAASNGFVAVLASQSNAVEARKALDDLQGKYGEVIGGKATDITQFDSPRDGKTYYRAVVGPPGSREAAAAVCTQMRAAGHKDCFAAPY